MRWPCLLMLIIISGCDHKKQIFMLKTECFRSGGAAFEYGESGGSWHHVCVYSAGDGL